MKKRKERTRACTTDYCKVHVNIPVFIYNRIVDRWGPRSISQAIRDLVMDRYGEPNDPSPNQYELPLEG